jgi:Flp pilus assembly protein TadG
MLIRPNASNGRTPRRLGAAAVELAVLAPFLAFLCVIAADWARLLYFSVEVNDCAKSGALYASDPTYAAQSRYATVTDAAMAEATELAATATVTSGQTTVSGTAYVTVTVAVPFKTITNFPGVPSSQTVSRTVMMRSAPQSAR